MVTKSDFRAFHLAERGGGGRGGRLARLSGSVSKGLLFAKPHPKAQEVHGLAPSRGRAFLNLLTGCVGWFPQEEGEGEGHKSAKK